MADLIGQEVGRFPGDDYKEAPRVRGRIANDVVDGLPCATSAGGGKD